jgi:hypothetical protein
MPPSIRFTAQEFEILWAAYGRDRLPYPEGRVVRMLGRFIKGWKGFQVAMV